MEHPYDVVLQEFRSEIKSHFCTSVVDNNYRVTHVYQTRCMNITRFDPTLGTVKSFEIGSTTLSYDYPMIGQIIVFGLNQAIYINTTTKNLACPV